MNIIKYDIAKAKKYTGRDGQEKTYWNNIGSITEFHKEDGSISRIIEIPAIGLEANIFPVREKAAPLQTNSSSSYPPATPTPNAPVVESNQNLDDIPF